MTRFLNMNSLLKYSANLRFARHLSLSAKMNAYKVENLLVIGSGLMGSGIVQSAAHNNRNLKSIVLQDISEDALNKAKSKIEQNLNKIKQKKADTNIDEIVSKITFSTSIAPKSTENLLIIEAVTENLGLKQELFKDLNQKFKDCPSVVFATNTSSLVCKDVAKHVDNMDRFVGLHFFNPVPLMKLVEIVVLENQTSEETYEAMANFVKEMGKVSVRCKDTPGFIVNRLLVPYMFEAISMLERGDASARDIDTAMKLGAGYPMGPFELIDYVGLDTSKFICDGWLSKNYNIIKESKLLNEMVAKGRLGKKVGKGFYDY
ncbi:hydroxyacyl-coenzyme A dehydrogenase: mitochondrial-like protein [Dinothrombium tinctorium]|uniref:3-hydroxyacyl-CoA dehydrogenase n=2 Tax=Dinothrombium tinctorium TaxID=1965070 RepID=A0A3S3PHY5_9ACAR|nr:hydroxyacyl-coenzyme A dehydrogenase: mitochondrial-like protein [Dinothrombium tinctorium]